MGIWQHIVLMLLLFVAVLGALAAVGVVNSSLNPVRLELAGQSMSMHSDVMLCLLSTRMLVRQVFGPTPRPPTPSTRRLKVHRRRR
jgi:hypothetical protein